MAEFRSDKNSIFKEVAKKASIVDVISYELGSNALVKYGKDYKCLCPFHNDHSPSMNVNVTKNSFKCFVDGHGGDAIHFVELYEHITPFEALKKVCQICNIPLPDEIKNQKRVTPTIELQYPKELEALKELSLFYQTFLSSFEGKAALDYLEKRKIPKESYEHFGLGFAPNDPSISIKALRNLGYDVPVLEKAGILSSNGELKDRYSYRLMYPIHDDYGHLVGFSGRKIRDEDTGGKYINYPATPLFNKSQILYHYYYVKTIAKKYGYVYLVEGFNDVIAFHRVGIESCVGNMGTAFTIENALSLKRLGVEVRLCLDKDEAGQEGMENILPMMIENDIPFRVVRPFKGGKDADEVLSNFYPNGDEELKNEANRLYDGFLFLLARLIKKHGVDNKVTDSTLVNQFINRSKPYYQKLDSISKMNDIRALSKVTDISEDDLKKIYEKQEQKQVEINPPAPTYEKKYYSYDKRARFNNYQERNYPSVNEIKDVNFDSKTHHFSSIANQFITASLEYAKNEKIDPAIVKLEAEIMLLLPNNRQAIMRMESSGVNFLFLPFYYLYTWIQSIYVANPTMTAFSNEQYQLLLDKLDSYEVNKENSDDAFDFEEDKENEDDSEAFDLDDISLDDDDKKMDESFNTIYSLKIDDDDIQFMKQCIQYIKNVPYSSYSDEQFENQLKAHHLIVKYLRRLEYCQKNNIVPITDKEYMSLSYEMKNCSISISKNLKNVF